jgi:hypothetical protein
VTVRLWQLVALIATVALGAGVLIGRYAVPKQNDINALGHEFESHLNEAFEARRGNGAAQNRIAERYGVSSLPTSTTAAPATAETTVRAAVPALDAYNADHGTYAGASLEVLQSQYGAGIGGVEVVWATSDSYCLESTTGGAVAHELGPLGDIQPGYCPEAAER